MIDLMNRPLFSLGLTEVTVGVVAVGVAVAIVTLVLARVVKRTTIRHFERHQSGDEVAVNTTANLMAALVLIVGLDIVLRIFGIRLTTLLAAGGLFGLGAGFAAKNLIENLLAGVILRMDRTIHQGDVIAVHDRLLQIERIGLRTTIGRTIDGIEIVIPNATVSGSTVDNLTREDRLVRVTVRVGVELAADLKVVREALESAVAGLDWKSDKHESTVLLTEFTHYAINYEVSVWVDDVVKWRQARSDLGEAISRELSAAGVPLS
jgi:potassium efflux system protein